MPFRAPFYDILSLVLKDLLGTSRHTLIDNKIQMPAFERDQDH
jgi:hypothetical protein